MGWGRREKKSSVVSKVGFQGALPELLAAQPHGCAKPGPGHDLHCGSALGLRPKGTCLLLRPSSALAIFSMLLLPLRSSSLC